METHFDVIVIGAGAGGLFTAALLAKRGYRTLVVESQDIPGGRASTRYKDGFAINTGAMTIEYNAEAAQVFDAVGAKLLLCRPSPGIVIRSRGRDINISSGVGGLLTRTAIHGLRLATRLFPTIAPKADENTETWIKRFTSNATALATLRNFCGSIFASAPSDLPADLFLHYVTTRGAFKSGFPPGGTISVWQPLIDSIVQRGGQLWLNATVTAVQFATLGDATGICVEKQGDSLEITASIVVSDVGPVGTLDLCRNAHWPADYTQKVAEQCHPSAIISAYFASQTPLCQFPGLACFSDTQRLCYAAHFTGVSPDNAPPGWHLYCGASVPKPAIGDFDEEAETQLLLDDLRREFPGFDQARLLEVVVTRGDWPAQRAIAGQDLSFITPANNVWNVGDAVKPWGNAAIGACAETALLVAQDITAKYPPPLNFSVEHADRAPLKRTP